MGLDGGARRTGSRWPGWGRGAALPLALALSWATPAPAAAQGAPPPAGDEIDRRAFEQGLSCFDRADYRCAIDAWEGLLERVGAARAWKLLYNLGVAHEAVGDATRALERWTAFLEVAPADAAGQQRRDAEARIASLRGRYGEIVVLAEAGVVARVGSGRERTSGFSILVAPGRHPVVLSRPGQPDQRVEVDAAAGGRVEVRWREGAPPGPAAAGPDDGPAAPAPASAPAEVAPTDADRGDGLGAPAVLAIAFGGATLASAALPIALGVRADGLRDEAIAAPTRAEHAAATDEFEGARTAYAVSYVLPAVLGAATVGFVIWALAEDDQRSATAGATAPVVRF